MMHDSKRAVTSFDESKVEKIKKSIADGSFVFNDEKIAENLLSFRKQFVKLKKRLVPEKVV